MTVSVVIPAYNAEATIARAIDSALVQTRPPDEIIVVDDGSRDGTGHVVRGYGSTVRYFRQENAGVSAAKNRALAEAKEEWIAFLDADDEWLPDKLASQVELLTAQPHLVWCFSGVLLEPPTDDRDGIARRGLLRLLRRRGYLPSFLLAAATGLGCNTPTMIIRRDTIQEVGGFNETLPRGGDMDIWMRIALRYPMVGYLPKPLARIYWATQNSLVKTYDAVPPGFRKLKANLLRARGVSLEAERHMLKYARRIAFRYFVLLALAKSHLEPEEYREYWRMFTPRVSQRLALWTIERTPRRFRPRVADALRQVYRV